MPSPVLPVLALDTATETIAAGVCADARVGAAGFTQTAPGGALASTKLLPLLRSLLARAGMEWQDIGAIAYGQGPGAFTGLRTACAVAQGLGFGIGCRLLPIDSLLIVAEDARLQVGLPESGDVAVAMDARMDEAYAAHYRWQGRRWHVVQAPALLTLPALNAAWSALPPRGVAAGSALHLAAACRCPPVGNASCWKVTAPLRCCGWRSGRRWTAKALTRQTHCRCTCATRSP